MPFYEFVDFIFDIFLVVAYISRNGHIHLGKQASRLARMGLVNNDGKLFVLIFRAYTRQNEREFVNGCNNYLLPRIKQRTECGRVVGPANNAPLLHELSYCVPNLPVKIHTVCKHDN